MKKFTATVIREIRNVEVEMPDDVDLDENESVEELVDKVYAAVPDGVIHHQSITVWNDAGAQVL